MAELKHKSLYEDQEFDIYLSEFENSVRYISSELNLKIRSNDLKSR